MFIPPRHAHSEEKATTFFMRLSTFHIIDYDIVFVDVGFRSLTRPTRLLLLEFNDAPKFFRFI